MCLLFLYLNPGAGPDDFCLVLASVRDEFFYRPSRICHFWERNPHIVGGMDFEEGRQGGTWLAMNSSGKVAALLNLMKPAAQLQPEKKSRGFLVVNYLESEADSHTYLRHLSREADLYSEFLLVTLDIRPSEGEVSATYYTNGEEAGLVQLPAGVHIFGNSAPSRPWRKVEMSKLMFEDLLRSRPLRRCNDEHILSDLFSLLTDETQFYPDEQLETDTEGHPQEHIRQLSSIFIRPQSGFYGSRTHTVILVDGRGQVDYVERTMREPIDMTALDRADWVTTRVRFNLDHIPNATRLPSRL